MTEQDDWKQGLKPRIADEVGYIIAAFCEKNIEIGLVRQGGGVGYMYAEGQLLVPEQDLQRVIDFLESQLKIHLRCDPEYVMAGFAILYFPSNLKVPEILDEIDRNLGEGRATPNHVLTTANGTEGEPSPCPATEPEEVYEGIEPHPPVCQSNGGAGIRIYIADTGLLPDAGTHPWLAGVDGQQDPLSSSSTGVGGLLPYVGHGTFVSGVVRSMAPAADVFVGDTVPTAGSVLETGLIADLQNALHSYCPDIFHIAVASPTRNSYPPLSFWTWLRHLGQHKGIICVAPAGNSGTFQPHWPGAFQQVVSVGALAADWNSRASFSNYGGWVDVYAPGRNIINAYATGQYTCKMSPYTGQIRNFYGMAKWSGTSFSSPIVTGLIAARMWRTGENGIEAAAALLNEARCRAIPGIGAIIRSCCNERECRCSRNR